MGIKSIYYKNESRFIYKVSSSVLLKAVDNDQYEMVKLLLSLGVDPYQTDNYFENVLSLAKSKKVVDLLKKHNLRPENILRADVQFSFPYELQQNPEINSYIISQFYAK